MRYYTLDAPDGPDGLVLRRRDTPEPGPHQVRVRMQAWSLNHRDLLIARGRYGPEVRPGVVPVSDGAGIIDSVGAAVRHRRVGERVAGVFLPRWQAGPPTAEAFTAALGGSVDGVLAEHVIFDEDAVVTVPEHLDVAEAATLPCAAVTAWQAVHEMGAVRPGQTVLVQGTGGVSIFALQLAVAGGARVAATSSTPAGLHRLAELGAEILVDYRADPRWGDTIAGETGGVDTVVEVGGTGTLRQSLRAVRTGGLIAVIGVLGAGGAGSDDRGINPVPLLRRALRVQGVYVGSRSMFEALNRAVETHRIRPVIDRTFPFSDAADAYRHLEAKRHVGKVVLTADGG